MKANWRAWALCALPLVSAEVRDTPAWDGLKAPKVAIIGAGAGGASAAYHLSQYARDHDINASITVFERNPYIGGRSTTVNPWDLPDTTIELGASIYVNVNHILVKAAEDFNLSTKGFEYKIEGVPELGIWNGQEFVVKITTEDSWWDSAKLLWRYGLAPLRANALMKSTVGKFMKMYEAPIFPWRSLSKVVQNVELTGTTAATGEQYLKENNVGDKFAKEVIQALTRVNYASNLGLIHGLETMVCLAANGANSIEGGNWQLFSHMLKASGAKTHLNTNVNQIAKEPLNGTYTLTYSVSGSETAESVAVFDTVILAAPLQFSKLVINPAPKRVPDQIPYVALHVTLFASKHMLDSTAFGLERGKFVPPAVLTTLPPGEDYGSDPDGVGSPGFFSISIVGSGVNPDTNDQEFIYKIFSAKPISASFLSTVLGHDVTEEEDSPEEIAAEQPQDISPEYLATLPKEMVDLVIREAVEQARFERGHTSKKVKGAVSWIHRKLWNSYPYEYPRVTFDETELDEGLWYTSGIESFISTMETSALSGKNVARLIVDEWTGSGSAATCGKKEYTDEEDGAGEKENLKIQGEALDYEGVGGEAQKPLKAKL